MQFYLCKNEITLTISKRTKDKNTNNPEQNIQSKLRTTTRTRDQTPDKIRDQNSHHREIRDAHVWHKFQRHT